MNREIKFRAWVKYLEMMVEVEHLHRNGDILPRNFADVFKAEGVALMQFTGLKDKNGKEIYEKDFVDYEGVLFKVEWKTASFVLVSQMSGEWVYLRGEQPLIVTGNEYEGDAR